MKKKLAILTVLFVCLLGLLCACGGPSASLNKKQLTLSAGEEFVLEAKLSGVEEAVWTSSDKAVVTVKGNGNTATVKAVAPGTATIVLSDGEKELAKCEVTVEDSPLFVFLPEGKLVLARNKQASVKAIMKTGLQGDAVWSSSDETIGTVEAQGLTAIVTAVKRGECTIYVKADGYTASFTLIVGLT